MGTGASSSPMLRPQAPVRHAFESTSRRDAPSGLGLDSADVRRRMVDRLRAGGVSNEPLLAALSAVPRHLFVDAALVTQAYEDTSLPIGLGQTISKPSVVARMIELLLQGDERAPVRSAGSHARDRHGLRLPGGGARPVGPAGGLDRATQAIARQGPRHSSPACAWIACAWSSAMACVGIPPTRPTTASSQRQAANRCRRPGSTSLPSAGAWSARCTNRLATGKCSWW